MTVAATILCASVGVPIIFPAGKLLTINLPYKVWGMCSAN